MPKGGWSRGHGGHTVKGTGEAECPLSGPLIPTKANDGGGEGGGSK